MDQDCGICRARPFAQWVLVSIGWHVVAKVPACSRCIGTIEQAHTETTHAAKPAIRGIEPHRYNPDAMAMGDCKVCGHLAEDHAQPAIADEWKPDPRCAWHDPGVSMKDLRPQECEHFPACGICHRRPAESSVSFDGAPAIGVCGTCRERGEEAQL
jgi:hypothetical protein